MKIGGDNVKELYETNADFRRYVDGYSQLYGMATDEVLEQALVKEYAEELISQDKQPL